MDDSTKLTDLGRYHLVRKIGRGGMGEVWLAEDPHLQRQVALKVLPQRNRDDQQFLARFEREARAAAALHHPHILPVHDYGQQPLPGASTVAYLVMSYVSGGSVEERLRTLAEQRNGLSQEEALIYLAQCAEAIDYAHAHGIIHRDIKPANMLLREDNWLLLTDFGIARIVTDTETATTVGAFLGTPTYMAPEQAQGHAVPASDIYSLAIVAYQLFTGRVPFQADNPLATTFLHAFTAPAAPRMYNPTLPLAFEVALLRGIAKDPAQRPLSATAYVTSLQQALEADRAPGVIRTPEHMIPQTDPPRAQPQPRFARRKLLVGASAGVLLIGGGVVAYALSPLGHRPSAQLTPTAGVLPAQTVAAKATANPYAPLEIADAFARPVGEMAWSPVKNTLVTWSQDNKVTLWEVSTPDQVPRQGAQQSIAELDIHVFPRWSPDGQTLAVGNAGFDSSSTTSIETLLYTGDLSRTIANIPANFIEVANGVHGIGWLSPSYLVAINDALDFRNLVLSAWNVQQPQQEPFSTTLAIVPTDDVLINLSLIATSPANATIAIGTSQGILLGQLHTASHPLTWQPISSSPSLNGQEIDALAWSVDGRYLAALNTGDNTIGVWDATQQYAPVLPNLDTSQISEQLTHLAWLATSQGSVLALAGNQGLVYLWSVGDTAAQLRTLPGSLSNQVTALAGSHDGHWLAASYQDPAASILLWRL